MSEQRGAYRAALSAPGDTTVGGILKLQNPEEADLIITRLVLDVTTEATGAANADAGVDDGGDVSSDNLIDGVDIGAAAGVFDNVSDAGTNGKGAVLWPSGEYLVITASADASGLAGNAYVEYVRR